MRSLLTRRPLAAAVALVAIVACADSRSPSAPLAPDTDAPALVAARSSTNDSYSPSYVASGRVLHRTEWENEDVTVSSLVTPERGGHLEIRSAGLKVTFPAGAVSAPLRVTATAFGGNKVVYQFGPHGTQFLVPIVIQQDLKDTRAFTDGTLAGDLFGGYTPAGLSDVSTDGTVNVSETFAVDVRPDNDRVAIWATFRTSHFSGYVLASGRTDSTTTKLTKTTTR